MGNFLACPPLHHPRNLDAASRDPGTLSTPPPAEIRRLEALLALTWRLRTARSRGSPPPRGKAPVAVQPRDLRRRPRVAPREARSATVVRHHVRDTTRALESSTRTSTLILLPPADVATRQEIPPGFRHVKLDFEGADRLPRAESHVRIGLGGMRKGFAVDKASKVLAKRGGRVLLLRSGAGSLRKGTKPDGTTGLQAYATPGSGGQAYFAMMPISDHAFSTAELPRADPCRRWAALP